MEDYPETQDTGEQELSEDGGNEDTADQEEEVEGENGEETPEPPEEEEPEEKLFGEFENVKHMHHSLLDARRRANELERELQARESQKKEPENTVSDEEKVFQDVFHKEFKRAKKEWGNDYTDEEIQDKIRDTVIERYEEKLTLLNTQKKIGELENLVYGIKEKSDPDYYYLNQLDSMIPGLKDYNNKEAKEVKKIFINYLKEQDMSNKKLPPMSKQELSRAAAPKTKGKQESKPVYKPSPKEDEMLNKLGLSDDQKRKVYEKRMGGKK